MPGNFHSNLSRKKTSESKHNVPGKNSNRKKLRTFSYLIEFLFPMNGTKDIGFLDKTGHQEKLLGQLPDKLFLILVKN